MGAPHRHARRWSHDRVDVAAGGQIPASRDRPLDDVLVADRVEPDGTITRHADVAAEFAEVDRSC